MILTYLLTYLLWFFGEVAPARRTSRRRTRRTRTR